ncbi:MAG: hypothetical protein JOZ85_12825 [Betaproteobacteria bacterium]|nr:hypothetical protein [Betaproteobacteria bacterium]
MHPVILATLCGLGFGVLAVVLMLPISFPDKRRALLAAFSNRFAIGFLAPLVALPLHGAVIGAIVGLFVSLSDAIVTKAYAPILGIGTVGGALIGWLAAAAAT